MPGLYRCSNCGATMSYPMDRCPQCNILLSGVKCEACGYIGGKSEFVDNGNRCPKCDSVAFALPKPKKPPVPYMRSAAAVALLSVLAPFLLVPYLVTVPLCIRVLLKADAWKPKVLSLASVLISASVSVLIYIFFGT